MTVRRVSRRSRRHLRRTAGHLRKPRVQRGGAQDIDHWLNKIKEIYTTRDPTTNEIIFNSLTKVESINEKMYITINGVQKNLVTVAATAAVIMYDFINKKPYSYNTYLEWYISLNTIDSGDEYKKQLLEIENELRNHISEPPISDIGIATSFPLYIWALVLSGDSNSISEAAENLAPALTSLERVSEELEKTRLATSQTASSTDQTIKPAAHAVQGESAP